MRWNGIVFNVSCLWEWLILEFKFGFEINKYDGGSLVIYVIYYLGRGF